MLIHQEQNEENEYIHTATSSREVSDTPTLSPSDAVEDYLDQLCAPLVGKVPRAKREEIRERVHLRVKQFVAAHAELGSSPEEAIELALVQSGAPELISRRWLPDQNSVQQIQPASFGTTTQKLSDRLFGTAKGATAVASLTFALPFLVFLTQASVHLTATPESDFMYWRAWMIAVPLVSGMLTGLSGYKRPTRGVVNALGIIVLQALALGGISVTMTATHIGPDITQYMGINLVAAILSVVPWLVFGVTGATLGQRIRKVGSRLSTRLGRSRRLRK